MRKLLVFILLLPYLAFAQKANINPTINPASFKPTDEITVTYDVTGTSLAALTEAWIWVWIPGKNIDARFNVNPATTAADPAKFSKVTESGKTLFRITFKPQDFFVQPICTETQLGMLIKAKDWSGGQSVDFLTSLVPLETCFLVELTSPDKSPFFVDTNGDLVVQAESNETADFVLTINGLEVNQQTAINNYTYTYQVPQTQGVHTANLIAGNDDGDTTIVFNYIIRKPSEISARPAGIVPGINYHDSDPSQVTLCLWAPLKSSAYVRGDFSDWEILSENLMYRDGEYFWLELTGLTPGQEYAFQYLVDETYYIADPYADKILDPDDQYIPASTYPNLKAFPPEALQNEWYYNRASVLQTNQVPYVWEVPNFEKPEKEKLVIYELLIRDFFDSENRNYQNLIDTLEYLEQLGITAIELMPIMEFNGNEGWGYNPAFMFAPDKYYGTKNKLKELVDACHKRGIAVILDIALNHQDLPNPFALMYFEFGADGTYGKPTADNPWFNRNPKHPFNVFYDMNHASLYTQAYVDSINHYWLSEFNVDGFRFDLSKGFTQTNNPSNVGAWGAYDASRIAILKRMADKIWMHHPEAYIILEHFADNSEEKELAQYRAAEGKGMMLWGNMNHAFNENTMGYSGTNDISGVLHSNRGWSAPRLVGYMESHDEERLMYKNLTFGNTLGTYSTKTLGTGLARMKAATTLFYSLPGPKMLWEFGELGYDKSINLCGDGTISEDCRLSPKPVGWNLRDDEQHELLQLHTADMLRLRKAYPVFTSGNATLSSTTSLFKEATIKSNPYTETPASENEMNVHIVANFELADKTVTINFPHTGTWYNYYQNGEAVNVTGTSLSATLHPGEFRLYTDYPIENLITDIEDLATYRKGIVVYPNPTAGFFSLDLEEPVLSLQLLNTGGVRTQPSRSGVNTWNIEGLAAGLYIVEIQTSKRIVRTKLIKQ